MPGRERSGTHSASPQLPPKVLPLVTLLRPTWNLLVIALALPLMVYFALSAMGGAVRVYQYQREMDVLRADVARLEERRKELEAQQLYLQSDPYIEKVAREELRLIKPGDQALVLLPGDRMGATERPEATAAAAGPAGIANVSFIDRLRDRLLGSGESLAPAARHP